MKQLVLVVILLFGFQSLAQETDSIQKRKFKDVINARGYVKYMTTASFLNGDSIITDNLIHHRLNLRGFINDHWTVGLELRNRIFYGQAVSLNPYLGHQLDYDPGFIDLSFTLVDQKSFVLHSTIDRGWISYARGKWDVRVGRQRINWGVNLAWNPNDLFNAYNLVDFDYQERPGSDAVRVQYSTGDMSNIDLAWKLGRGEDSTVLAGMYKFNKWKYDFQFLAGNYYKDLSVGMGWAGNIKNAGFKGELSYFHPRKHFEDTTGVFTGSLSVDQTFGKGIYLNGSFLYNSSGVDSSASLTGFSSLFSGPLSAKRLMPSKYTYFLQVSGSFTPIISASLATFYMQGVNLLFFMPTIGVSIQNNWDLSLIGYSTFGDLQGFKNLGNSIFLRLQFSY